MKRNQSLDVLRGVAILMVVWRHYLYPSRWCTFGFAGVDLFFVLSGFLISGLLFSEYQRFGSIDLKRFWIRRGFKIYPAFYFFIAWVIGDYALAGALTKHIFSDLFFLQDYITPIAEHGWSLGVEEKFYFALPVLLILMILFAADVRDPFRRVPHIFVALFAGCLGLRVVAAMHNARFESIYHPAHLRMDSLFAGVTLAYFQNFRRDEFQSAGRLPVWIPGITLASVPLAFWDEKSLLMDTLGFAMLSIGFALLTLWAVNQTFPEWAPLRAVAWLGRYSYSIYLWHFAAMIFLSYEITRNFRLFPVYITSCIGVGWLAAYLIETPFLKLRDRLYPARSHALAATARDAQAVLSSLPDPVGGVNVL